MLEVTVLEVTVRMAPITRVTSVADALGSSMVARKLFLEHGINPEWFGEMTKFNTLGDAERWCDVKDIDRLIDDLRALP